MKRICRVQGIAVCWSPDAVYYIPLNPAAPGVDKFVAGMMANKRAQKITFDLKSQMVALLSGSLLHTSTILYAELYCNALYCNVQYRIHTMVSIVAFLLTCCTSLLVVLAYQKCRCCHVLTAPTVEFVFCCISCVVRWLLLE